MMRRLINAAFLGMLLICGALTQEAAAATYTVNRTDDPDDGKGACATGGSCSLRQAANTATDTPTDDTINFAPSIHGQTITLSFGRQIRLISAVNANRPGGDLVIDGPGAHLITIDGGGTDRIFWILSAELDVTIRGVTLQNGNGHGDTPDILYEGFGGAIMVFNARLTLDGVILQNNRTTASGTSYRGYGGAVFATGTSGSYPKLTIKNSTVRNNQAVGSCGGIGAADLEMDNTVVSGNTAPGDGSGGGLCAGGLITNSEISFNRAGNGGGISGSPTIVNSTISGNTATNNGGCNRTYNVCGGGGIAWGGGDLYLKNVTVTDNHADNGGANGGGIVNVNDPTQFVTSSRGRLFLHNSIIAGNTNVGGDNTPDIYNPYTTLSEGYNLIGNTNGVTITGNTTGNRLNVNAQLNPLAHNGNFTRTHSLGCTSPALNAGDPTTFQARDQRGVPRPLSERPEIGAYESNNCGIVVTNNNDSGLGSLRQAIQYIDGGSITFSSSFFNVPRTISVVGEMVIDRNVTIEGPGAHLLALDGRNQNRLFRVASGGTLILSGMRMSNGNAGGAGGGAIYNGFSLTASRVVVETSTAATGGGIYTAGGAVSTINSSTIAGNTAGVGGGVTSDSITIFNNSTIANNIATTHKGGGIYVNGHARVDTTNSTISGNHSGRWGGGVYVEFMNGGLYQTRNTIIAGNTSVDGCPDVSGEIATFGYNLVGNSECNSFRVPAGGSGVGNIVNPSGGAKLSPLFDNGGHMKTFALQLDSPARDAGDPNNTFSEDQRGAPRPAGTKGDIGAYELSVQYVTNYNNDGAGSLRRAITDSLWGGIILFQNPPSTMQTIPLSGGIVIDKSLTIVGPGADKLTLDANHTGRILSISTGLTLNLSGVRLLRGHAGSNFGGAIRNLGILFLSGVRVESSAAASGGGLYNDAGNTVVIRDSIFFGNTATGNGGAIMNLGMLDAQNVTIDASTAGGGGGGISNTGTAHFMSVLSLVDSTIKNSSASNGGGILNGRFAWSAHVLSSTLSGNTAGIGGGVYNENLIFLNNSTIANNTATLNKGGGIYIVNDARADTTNSTISGNRSGSWGGGVYVEFMTRGVYQLRNTIIAGNTSGDGCPDVSGQMASFGYNLVGNNECNSFVMPPLGGSLAGNLYGTPASPLNARFAPLGNYGGPTQTMALLLNSPATNVGDTNNSFATDQRGSLRPIGGGADMGAFERNVTFDHASWPNGAVTVPYNQTLTATRLSPPTNSSFTFSIISITGQGLPPGLTLAADGTLSGTPTATGTYVFTVKATDADGMAGAQQFTLTIGDAPPSLSVDDVTHQEGDSGTTTYTFIVTKTSDGAATVDFTTVDGTATAADGDYQANSGTLSFGVAEITKTIVVAVNGDTHVEPDEMFTVRLSNPSGATISIADAAGKILNDDYVPTGSANPAQTNEDTTVQITLTGTDADGDNLNFTITDAPDFGTLSAISAPDCAPANTCTATVTYTPNLNYNGADSFKFKVNDGTVDSAEATVNITITEANDTPDAINDNLPSVNEDSGQFAIPFATLVGNDTKGPANENGQTLTVTLAGGTGNPVGGTVVLDTPNSQVLFTPNADFFGTASFDYTITDDGTTNTVADPKTDTATASFAVNAVNDEPSFTTGPDQSVVINPGPQTVSNWATNISAGPADENPQTLTFSVTNNNNALFTVAGQPAVSPSGTLTYEPATGASGVATISMTLMDNGGTANGGDDTSPAQTFTITLDPPAVSVQEAGVPEPTSPNTTNMVFTVSLTGPALGPIAVNFTTNNGTATAGTCGDPGADYVTTSGTIDFVTGDQVKTINVPICSDGDNSEGNETLTITLSGAAGANITDGTATGTITVANPAATLLISELRTAGPGGAGDDFVELYNNTNSSIDVSGYGLFKVGPGCNATPVLVAALPGAPGSNTTVIPARGHYLLTGAAYSLKDYGGTDAAMGNATLMADIETDANLGLFATTDVASISSVNLLDAVGFGANTGGVCDLLREGSALPAIGANATTEHSYFRKMCDWIQGQGCTVPGVPKDTNLNADDFWLADTNAITGRLGSPGPENLASPIRRDNANNPGAESIDVFRLDGNVGAAAHPNRTRNASEGTGSTPTTFGTMTMRYRVTNNSTNPVTRLRYRIVDITAIQGSGPSADLRALTGVLEPTVGPVHDSVSCAVSNGGNPSTPCNVTVNFTTLETPSTQAAGGGYNSTLSSGTINTGSPLAPGASILINFKLGVEKTGLFRFYIIIEALP